MDEKVFELLYKNIEPEEVDVMSMTVGDVILCMVDIQKYCRDKKKSLTKSISFVKGFENSIKNVWNLINSTGVPYSPEWERASNEVGGSMSVGESILCDTVNYYGLHSTSEAEKLPFSDWFIMKKKEVVSAAVERRYNKIMEKKRNSEWKIRK